MAKALIGGRPSKEALGRMKVVTVAVSIAAFAGSLGVIAANGTPATVAASSQEQASQIAFSGATTGSRSRSGAASTTARPGFSAPVTRSRGS